MRLSSFAHRSKRQPDSNRNFSFAYHILGRRAWRSLRYHDGAALWCDWTYGGHKARFRDRSGRSRSQR